MAKPINNYRLGAIQIAEWAGEKSNSYTIQRSYKQGSEWKHTNFLNINDLLKLLVLIPQVAVATGCDSSNRAASPQQEQEESSQPQQEDDGGI
jgi:hypothetical protein